MTFDSNSNFLSTKPLTKADLGNYNVIVVASYFDGVGPFLTDSNSFIVTIFCIASITADPTTLI